MYEYYIILTVHVHVSLHFQALSVLVFNGLNFSTWCEQVQFHLDVLDLNLSLQVEKPTAIIDINSDKDKTYYDT